ncbi:hypothetical protein CIHG_08663 [Coccidioides immitis H538.4]|uniref:Uncharacterized protein n=1 Tax=Coccidioides immitis H538.4 TaxID=396776 RepID=A0A0J8USP4_COCIT|nr:hypothetical protein CIHG_08663 [Coccidioides immitis H538.4]
MQHTGAGGTQRDAERSPTAASWPRAADAGGIPVQRVKYLNSRALQDGNQSGNFGEFGMHNRRVDGRREAVRRGNRLPCQRLIHEPELARFKARNGELYAAER